MLKSILYKFIQIYFRTVVWFKNKREWVYYALLFGSCIQIFGLILEGFFGWSAYLDKTLRFYVAFALILHNIMILNENNSKYRIS